MPILPTVILGAQRVWTKRQPKNLGRSNTPIHIAIAPPMTVAPDEDPLEATARLRATMIGQLDALWQTYPPMPADQAHLVPASRGGTAPTQAEADVIHRADAERRRAEAARKAQRAAEEGDGRAQR